MVSSVHLTTHCKPKLREEGIEKGQDKRLKPVPLGSSVLIKLRLQLDSERMRMKNLHIVALDMMMLPERATKEE